MFFLVVSVGWRWFQKSTDLSEKSSTRGLWGPKRHQTSDHGEGVVVAVGEKCFIRKRKKFLTVVIGFVVSIRSLLDTVSFDKLYQLIFEFDFHLCKMKKKQELIDC